jgi:photosystem II stability/assembly factor-like uncharacterized protein
MKTFFTKLLSLNFNKIILLLFFVTPLFFTSCIKQKIDASTIEINSPTKEDLNDIHFVNDSIGFIVGGTKYDHGVVLKTTNAGDTWMLDSFQGPKTFYDIAQYREKIYTSGYDGFFYSSADNGNSWTQPGYTVWMRFNSISFNDIGEFFVGIGDGFERGEILYSTNEGSSWARIDTFTRTIKTIVFHHGVGFAGSYGIIYKSLDQGRTWKATKASGDFFTQIIFTSNNIGYAIGYFGMILKTTDGGETWSKILNENFSFNEKSNFYDAYFIDDNTGYIVGDNGYIIYTNNGGKKWKQISKFTEENFRAIDKIGNQLILVGSNGKIFKMNIE